MEFVRGTKVAMSKTQKNDNNTFTYPDANESIAARTAALMLLG